MRIYFIGGFFEAEFQSFILNNSKGVIQNAAHVFQYNILKGMDQVFDNGVFVINLPFLGSYPFRFKKFIIPPDVSRLFVRSKVFRLGFINVLLIKQFSRFFSVFSFFVKKKLEPESVVIIYSLHLPFIAAAVFSKHFHKESYKVYVIVPDLPEYMSDSRNILYRFLKFIDGYLIKKLISYVDGFILLTEGMADRLKLKSENFIVVEGVASEHEDVSFVEEIHANSRRILLYSGTLAKRYGICELIDAFMSVTYKDVDLWVCGEGDGRNYVENAIKIDNRIKYFGQLPRDKVVKLQLSSTILVNPRTSDGIYTKYSFPSKIIEYMASGRPVIMHALPGIPKEYFDHCYVPETADAEGLKDCLETTLSLSEDALYAKGLTAKNFILKSKSSYSQAIKIKSFIEGNKYEK